MKINPAHKCSPGEIACIGDLGFRSPQPCCKLK